MIGFSQPNEVAYAGEIYSIFTYVLLKGLYGAGSVKQDGYVQATDLVMYASLSVPKLTNDEQHPVLDTEKSDNFILAYSASSQQQPKELPSELKNAPKIESQLGELNGFMQTRNTVASGNCAVAIGGNAQGSAIIRDKNVVGSRNVGQKVILCGECRTILGNAQNLHIGDTIDFDEE
jgi:hypothetical protein